MIHHYTSIETLEKILRSATLRFTRLDCMDDVLEEQVHGGLNWGKKLFVCCWTLQLEESIDQWRTFGQFENGVRLSLPTNPFGWHLLRLDISLKDPETALSCGFTIKNMWAPFDKQKMLSDGLVLVPHSDMPCRFGGKVNYFSDVESEYKKFVTGHINDSGVTVNLNLQDLARYKTNTWAHQREYRFVLQGERGPSMRYEEGLDCQPVPSYKTALIKVLKENAKERWPGYQQTYIDLPFDPLKASAGVVTAGPLVSQAEFLKLQEMVIYLVPGMSVRKSCFTGKIR